MIPFTMIPFTMIPFTMIPFTMISFTISEGAAWRFTASIHRKQQHRTVDGGRGQHGD